MELTKENAKNVWLDVMKKSWTYALLTDYEKKNINDLIENRSKNLQGNGRQRYSHLQDMYSAFLSGLGYYNNPITWRESMKEVSRV